MGKMEVNKVYLGDCLELMKEIPDKSIDMILCDLPYGTTACSWDTIIPFEPLWKHYERIIKDNGAIILTASQPFTSQLLMSNPNLFKYELIWEKQKGTGFVHAKFKPLKSHENILVFSKSPAAQNKKHRMNYNPIFEVGSPYLHRSAGQLHKLKTMSGGNPEKITSKNDGFRYPKSILKFNTDFDRNSLHPTQKPVALFEYLIKTYTNEGDLVLDNCAGSGTTGISCINTNRNYILMEKEEEYYNVILERIKNHSKTKFTENDYF